MAMNDDGIYFFGEWVAEVSVVTNKQANDLTTPATLNTTYANFFNLPDTARLRAILKNAEQLDSGGRDPYRLIPAKVIEEGEVIFSGSASLQTFQGGWKVSLAGPAKSLFDQLTSLKLSDLDLSQFDHPWTLESVAKFVGKTEGVIYPLIDYGSIDAGVFAQDTVSPAVYASTLIRQMLKQCGYRVKNGGTLETDELVKRLFLPFVNESPSNHDQEWIDDRFARVGLPNSADPIVLKNGHPINILLPFTIDNQTVDNFQDGALNCYDASRATYVCRESGRFNVQSALSFVGIVRVGAPEVRLIVEKNGQKAGEAYWTASGYKDFLDSATAELLNLDVTITCRSGDELRIRLTGNSKTSISAYGLYFSQVTGDAWASFSPDASIKQGDVWPVARNLPDMSCAELLKSIALMCSATFDVNEMQRTLDLKMLSNIVANEANAFDLSHSIEESDEPELSVTIEPYAQRNLLKWKEQEKKTNKGYGDGAIGCNARNIPAETVLFELPFSAVLQSVNSVPGYGNPVFIETRTVSGKGDTLTVSAKAASPCLLLAEPTVPVTVTVNMVTPELTTNPVKVQLTPCWWHEQAPNIQLPNNRFSLAFDLPIGSTAKYQQTMSVRYFGGLKRVLRRPRQLTLSAYLQPHEFASIDLYAPIRLKNVRCGSLDLNDGFYYLNGIKNYRAPGVCNIVLIAY